MMWREQKETHHGGHEGEFVAYYLLGIIQGILDCLIFLLRH